MGGTTSLSIILDKPDKTYYSGETITGHVRLVLDSVKKIRAVELIFEGKAECEWNEQESHGTSHTRTTSRKSTETYLKTKQVLIGGRGEFDLAAGEHIYPFSTILPNRVPTSFTGRYGGVSYHAHVKIDIPMAFDKHERVKFIVINLLNLNLFSNLRTSYKNEKTKTFCCLCCKSGPLTVVVHLPKTGFAISESIPITLEVDNASNVTVDAVNIYLKRKIKWTAQGHHRYEDKKLQELRLHRVEEGQSRTWSEYFMIPLVKYPNLRSCSIIEMNHELHIEAQASMHFDLDMRVPITIGDIPLSEDPNAPIDTPQPETYPNNMFQNPNSNPDYQPENVTATAPPNLDFLAPSSYPHTTGIPQMPPLPASPGYSQSNYFTSAHPVPGGAVPVQQYQPEIPHQSAFNPDYDQNDRHDPAAYNSAVGYGLTLPSFDTGVQLEKSSFLNDSKSHTNY